MARLKQELGPDLSQWNVADLIDCNPSRSDSDAL